MTNILEVLRRERVVVVIRGAEATTLGQELRALYEGGLRIFEVTVEAPGAISALASVREQLPQDAVRAQYLTQELRRSSLLLVLGSSLAL